MHRVAPSILSADFSCLQSAIGLVNNSQADWIHVDVMDGVFVPNLSFGFPVLKALQMHALKPLDVHLMIVNPSRYLEEFSRHGAQVLTVHWEAELHLHRTIHTIKSLGMKAGVAINPHTPASLLHDILPDLDLVCVMSVNPGFGGQTFLRNSLHKIRQLSEFKKEQNLSFLIEVDGGVDIRNAPEIIQAGADVLVAGNTVFSSPDPLDVIARLKNI